MAAPPPPPSSNLGQVPKPKKKWAIQDMEDKSWKLDKAKCFGCDISGVNWKTAIGFSSSSEGSGGVFFVGWKDNSVAVVKGSSTVLADQYAAEIGSICNMPFPQMRTVRYIFDKEFDDISTALERLNVKKTDSERNKSIKMMMLPHLSIMEYINGRSLFEIDCKEVFSDPILGKRVCKEIGRLAIFDVLVNNWDRIPLIWDNEGNLGNIMITKDLGVVGIDQSISSISPTKFPEKFQEYLQKVRDLIRDITEWNVDGPVVGKIRQCISNNLGYDIETEGSHWICVGMAEAINDIAINVTDKHLREVYDKMEASVDELMTMMMYGQDTQSKYGLTKIDLEFLNGVLEVFKANLESIQTVLAKTTSNCK